MKHLSISQKKSKCLWMPCRKDETFLRGVKPKTRWATYNGRRYKTLHQPITAPVDAQRPKTCAPLVTTLRLLGVIFDSTGTFSTHVNTLIERLKRRISVMRRLTSRSWGSNIRLLIITYKAIIQNVMSYGLCAWGGFVPEEKIQRLNIEIHPCLRPT